VQGAARPTEAIELPHSTWVHVVHSAQSDFVNAWRWYYPWNYRRLLLRGAPYCSAAKRENVFERRIEKTFCRRTANITGPVVIRSYCHLPTQNLMKKPCMKSR